MEILDYNVIKNNNFDRTKSYFSCYYKSIILFTDYDAKSYNFAIRYNDATRNNELYVILYKDKIINNKFSLNYKEYVEKIQKVYDLIYNFLQKLIYYRGIF